MSRAFLSTLFILGLSFASACAASGDLPVADADSPELIREWLVCGPFPNPLAPGVEEYLHDETTLGYFIDYLAPVGVEAGVQPREGMEVAPAGVDSCTWRRHATPDGYVDLHGIYEKNNGVVGYGATWIHSGEAKEVVLALGSNDGIKVWLNGAIVWENHRPRMAAEDEDFVRVHLREGDNLLLVKVDQGGGGWGFYGRVLSVEEAGRILAEEAALDRIPELELDVDADEAAVAITMGRVSRFCVLDPPPGARGGC